MDLTRIMIVEDEIITAQDMRSVLERRGYVVTALATSGEEAIGAAERQRPDIILMDIMLQGSMNGFEAAAVISRQWGIPIVYVTSHHNDAALRQAGAAVSRGYLLKPFSEHELCAKIEQALADTRSQTPHHDRQ